MKYKHSESHQIVGIALAGLIALASAMGIGRFVYTPILPFMVESLQLSKSQAGIIASANFLGYMLGALAAAIPSLPGGRRNWFIAGLAMSAVTTAAMGASGSIPVFITQRFIGGVASAFVLILGSALVFEKLALAHRTGLSALHFAGVGFGIVVSAVLVSALAAYGYDWRVQWYASGLLSLLALVVVIWLVPVETEVAAPVMWKPGKGLNHRLIVHMIAYGLFGFGYIITATFISTIVRASPELSGIEPIIWVVVGLGAIPSVSLWNWISQRIGIYWSFSLACLVEAIGVAISVLPDNEPAIILSAVLLGGTFVGITALGLGIAGELSRGSPRQGIALVTAFFALGQMIGPTFAGYTYAFGDSFLVPSLSAAFALVIAASLVAGLARK
ncbi:MAG: YbfB/YjiJ family MFS transporter [Gammaproteobacteria bacterium]